MQQEDFSKYNGEGTQLRKAQLRMLEILIEIDKICRRHSIPYWIDFGTLLGAIRHKGFIPWDDDVDICVMEKDYKHLREILIKELPPQYVFQDTSTDKYAFFTYGRVRDKKSYCYYPYFVKLKEQGLWVDIFRYEEVYATKLQNVVDFFYRRAYHEIHHYGDVAYKSKWEILFKRVIAYIIYPFTLCAKRVVRFLGEHSTKDVMGRWTVFPRAKCYKHNVFPLTEVEFEGHKFCAPGNWDEHLKVIYGNYMQVPPPEKREQVLDMKLVKIEE